MEWEPINERGDQMKLLYLLIFPIYHYSGEAIKKILEKTEVQRLKDAFYFSHDSNARSDLKIQALRSKYGMKGYGMYWVIVEMMRESKDHTLPFNQKFAYYGFANEFACTYEEAKNFINDCIYEFALFVCNENSFWSDSLNRRMDKYKQKINIKSENGTKGGRPRKEQSETHTEDVLINITEEHKPIKEKRATNENATVAHYSSDVEYLTDLLANKIKENNSNAKIPAKLDAWKKDINSMIELDKYRFEQVARIIEFCQHDDFWKSNILSAKKLREKAGTLILQMQRSKPKEKKSESPQEMFERLSRLMEERDNNEQKRNDSAIDVDAVFL